MRKPIKISNRSIGSDFPPFIIAEMSSNHNHSLQRAIKIVEAAAKSGVQAIKLQTYTADTLTLNENRKEFIIGNSKSPWKGLSLYKLYKKAYTPWNWHKPIFKRCQELGLIYFSTPFDEKAVDFLESLNVPAYKIASFENTHIPLIRKVASTKKPIFISTGMATAAELDEAISVARKFGSKDIILLKCTSTYPAIPADSNLLTIPHMKQLFGTEVGISDHTLGIGVSVAAVALGATAIEKHFTLSREDGGLDATFSIEPEEMKHLVEESYRAWQSLGSVFYGILKSERPSRLYRRSLYVGKNIKIGEVFTSDNVKIIRPGLGLPPRYYDAIIGKRARKNIKKGIPLQWSHVEQ